MQEQDFAFAKALQDQENAWTQYGTSSPAASPEGTGQNADLDFAQRLQAQELRLQYMQLLNSAPCAQGLLPARKRTRAHLVLGCRQQASAEAKAHRVSGD